MVNKTPSRNEIATEKAGRELSELYEQTEKARVVLAQLQRDVARAGNGVGSLRQTQLLEANERLIVATLYAQTDTEVAVRALREMSRSTELDTLTNLPNRVLLLDRFAHAIAVAKRRSGKLALLFLDLNNFKLINDTLGHAVGDEVLKLAAHCMALSVRGADTVSRYGGDEFVILLAEVSHAAEATLVANKVLVAIGATHRFADQVLRLTASIGISVYPDDGEDAATLLKHADSAMYHAKKHGLGSSVFRGMVPAEEMSPAALAVKSLQQPLAQFDPTRAEHDHQHAQLREANEQLVLAALSSEELRIAAESAQRRQTEFLAVVAHEMRNPLAPILTAVALLNGVAMDEWRLLRVQAIIERQVEHLSRLVNDLIDVSRANTGKLRLERVVVDMMDSIEAAIEACKPAMDKRSQHFNVHIPPCAYTVYGDPVRLTQIMSNLLDNASKYTPDAGEISLLVATVEDSIVLTVSDNGIGITAEALSHVFEPFVQDRHATGFNGAGLGIGLTVVRELVEGHGGYVTASSAGLGFGSQLVVTLPLVRLFPAAPA